jgi:uncharacterized protein (TIGR02145 family)
MKSIILAFVLSLLLFSTGNAQYCSYLPGDINSSGSVIPSVVTYGVRYLKGIGTPPPDSCTYDSIGTFNHYLYVAADVNASCTFTASDITRLISYFKGVSALQLCRFFPPLQVPVLTTAAVSAVTQTTAICGGTIISDGGAPVIARGVCWSTDSIPTVADSKTSDSVGVGSFTSSITGLAGATLYYVRAYATNSAGTGYGSITSFYTTDSTGTMTDIDGNIYRTVKIGTQWWMAENLKATHYRNGDAIPHVTNDAEWENLTSGAYCNYNNDTANVITYGRLYNWYSVDDSRTIAPVGWHVPTDAEWQTLVNYLGGDADAGGKMKESGILHWMNPNSGATNESGFSALPGGYRMYYGNYYYMGSYATFWSSTASSSYYAWYRRLDYDYSLVLRYNYSMQDGFSVRCVRD